MINNLVSYLIGTVTVDSDINVDQPFFSSQNRYESIWRWGGLVVGALPQDGFVLESFLHTLLGFKWHELFIIVFNETNKSSLLCIAV